MADDITMSMDAVRLINGPAARMKETVEDEEVRTAAFRVTAGELRAFVERVERLEEEKRETADQIKEVFAEAKGRGYLVKALKKLIAERRRDPDDVSEETAIMDLYRSALGM